MQRKPFLGALVAACVVGAGVGLSTSVYAQVGVDEIEGPSAVLEAAFQDSGPSADVEAVRTAIPKLIRGDVAGGRLTSEELDNPADLTSSEEVEAREESTEKVWAPSEVAEESAALEDGIEEVIDDPSYVPFISNRFVVTSWQGIRISGDDAYGELIGHSEFKNDDGTWSVDKNEQHQVHLTRDASAATKWLLVDRFAIYLGGE